MCLCSYLQLILATREDVRFIHKDAIFNELVLQPRNRDLPLL